MKPGTHIPITSDHLSEIEYEVLKFIKTIAIDDFNFTARQLAEMMNEVDWTKTSKALSKLVGRDLIWTDGSGEVEVTDESTYDFASKGWVYCLPLHTDYNERTVYALDRHEHGLSLWDIINKKGKLYKEGLWPNRFEDQIIKKVDVKFSGQNEFNYVYMKVPPQWSGKKVRLCAEIL